MGPKTIFVPFLHEEEGAAAFAAAATIARAHDSHIVAAHMRQRLLPPQMVYFPLGGAFPLENEDAYRRAEDEHAAKMRAVFEAGCAAAGVTVVETPIAADAAPSASWRDLEGVVPDDLAALAAAFDLSVIAAETDGRPLREQMIEDMLSRSGRPAIIAPPVHSPKAYENVLIAWNQSAEAARAVAAAGAFLQAAKSVRIVTVTEPSMALGGAADIAATLRRHGVSADVTEIEREDRVSAEATLLSEIDAAKPDLLVMGAYSHNRLRQVVFGGVTRRMLREAPYATLMMR